MYNKLKTIDNIFCISSDKNLPTSKKFLTFRDISKVDQIRDYFLRN